MKKLQLPSMGFVYLLFVIMGFAVFILWVTQVGWYDRIHTPRQTQADLVRWDEYKQNITYNSTKGVAVLVDPSLWTALPRKVIGAIEEQLKVLFLPSYTATTRVTNIARENFIAGQRDWRTISLLLDSIAEKADATLSAELVAAILVANFPEKQILGDGALVALGLTTDGWTQGGQAGFILVSKGKVRLNLGCYAGPQDTPLTVTIENQTGSTIYSHVFKSPGNITLELPDIPVGDSRIFIIKTDKYWVPPKNDTRQLGVRLIPSS